MHFRTVFLLLFLPTFIFFFPGREVNSTPIENNNDTLISSLSLNKSLLLRLVNDIRNKGCRCGGTRMSSAPPLIWNDKLEKAAFSHANDMSRKKYFSHNAPDGSDPGARILRAGYKWMGYGENIAEGFRSEKEVVDSWLKSKAHCKNIMNPAFKEVGIARVNGYWVMDLGDEE